VQQAGDFQLLAVFAAHAHPFREIARQFRHAEGMLGGERALGVDDA